MGVRGRKDFGSKKRWTAYLRPNYEADLQLREMPRVTFETKSATGRYLSDRRSTAT